MAGLGEAVVEGSAAGVGDEAGDATAGAVFGEAEVEGSAAGVGDEAGGAAVEGEGEGSVMLLWHDAM